jgi:hypothetical protein
MKSLGYLLIVTSIYSRGFLIEPLRKAPLKKTENRLLIDDTCT